VPAGAFDLLVVFGLLHHVPGRETRAKLLTTLARGLGPAGTLIVTFWQFGARERFQKKFRSWESFNRKSRRPIDLTQLEAGDQLLSWGEDPTAQRYCHFISPEEAQLLLSNLKLRCLDAFSADGTTGDLNQYYLLGRC
jgi:SAM-dependent methyltransferase